jgi:hypothetical protein
MDTTHDTSFKFPLGFVQRNKNIRVLSTYNTLEIQFRHGSEKKLSCTWEFIHKSPVRNKKKELPERIRILWPSELRAMQFFDSHDVGRLLCRMLVVPRYSLSSDTAFSLLTSLIFCSLAPPGPPPPGGGAGGGWGGGGEGGVWEGWFSIRAILRCC